MQNPYDKYKQNSVTTATKEELTLMLYEGALKFCNRAITAIESNDTMGAHNAITRVQDIIREFQITLNRKYEVSKNFDVMYEYIHRRLIEANIRKDKDILLEMRDLLRQFRDLWKEAMVAAKEKK